MKYGAATAAPETGAWPDDEHGHAPARWQRPGGRIAWGRVFATVGAIVVLAWAALSPGGLEARLTGVDSGLKHVIANITENRALESATTMFDKWYAQQGSYPQETQSQLDQDPNASWGPGMDVQWCSPRDVVLTSLTISGTVSRLLLDGKPHGDITGKVACPANPNDPSPWSG